LLLTEQAREAEYTPGAGRQKKLEKEEEMDSIPKEFSLLKLN
jgi:hypothetical protein